MQPFGGLGNLNRMAHHDTENDETMVARKRGAWEIFARIFVYIRRYPRFAIGTIACAVVSTLAGLAFRKLTQLFIDEVISARRGNLLCATCSAFCASSSTTVSSNG